jgi:hypothetical protein
MKLIKEKSLSLFKSFVIKDRDEDYFSAPFLFLLKVKLREIYRCTIDTMIQQISQDSGFTNLIDLFTYENSFD